MPNISEAKQKEIREARENTKSIDLSNLGLNDEDMDLLQELLQNKPHITSVNLSFNAITAQGCRIIILLPHLRIVNFAHNHLGDAAIEYIVKTGINKLDISFNGLSDVGAKVIAAHLDKYSELDIDGNPRISRELADKIRSRFVKNVFPSSSPIGIDLGMNVVGSLPDNFFSQISEQNSFEKKPAAVFPQTSQLGREQVLADKLFEMYAAQIQKFSQLQKEELIKRFSKSIGLDVQVASKNPTQKV